MKTQEIVAFNRKELGSKTAKQLRREACVPAVVYGAGKEPKQIYVPMIQFRDLVYTPVVSTVMLNIEGEMRHVILQDIQYHPVSETILHADFLELEDDKPVKMNVPIKLTGSSVGVQKGGKLLQKLRTVRVKSLPKNLPDFVPVDVSALDLGKSTKVGELKVEGFEILNSPLVTIVTIEIPRSLRTS